MKKWQRALYQPGIPLGADGKRVTGSTEHIALSKEAAKEAMVLLKNEKELLPLKPGARVALFGKGTFDYVKGGGGSGDVTVAYIRNLYDGMKALSDRVTVCEEVADYYRQEVEKQYKENKEPGMLVEPELSEELCRRGRNFADTAIISISRFSGEGWDRKSIYDKKEKNPLFEEGDFYLSHREKEMVQQVCRFFDKVVVVLNVGGVVDTAWFRENPKIQAVLLAWQCGIEGGLAAAELLCGCGNPSGKLADTFAKTLEDYPSTKTFHESEDYVDYIEDIYVGYRYFLTIPGVKKKVCYPFGYGLSYTTFRIQSAVLEKPEDVRGNITISAAVTNTGKYPGKEVVQVYVKAPRGKLGKAERSLVTFEKTRMLQPGETQELFLTFSLADCASYDDLGKIKKSAYLLEAGTYEFYVGNSSVNAQKSEDEYPVPDTVIVEQLSSRLAPVSLKERMTSDGSMEPLYQGEPRDTDDCGLEFCEKEPLDGLTPEGRAVPSYCLWGEAHKHGIRTFEEVAEGRMSVEEFAEQMTDEELAFLLGGQPNTGVANTFGIGNMPDYRIPSIMTADGPAGLRIAPECGVNTTAWPCATALACTWNPKLVQRVGAAGALEVKENNICVWLTPAVNIHRSLLCGRNFEYYSEDPLLTGVMAAAMVEGIQSRHIAATVKHFALNNKETNRKNSDSRVSERAAREIYLKPFEYIVKHAHPWCIMSSYNIVNGYRASENKELLTDILRKEWGFDGVVTSDWWSFGEHYKEVEAGNDVKMPLGFPKRLTEAVQAGLLTREDLLRSACNVLRLILKMD